MKTWYVRPRKTGTYGIGDGTSYDNAFNGTGNYAGGVAWANIMPGDTIYICDSNVSALTIVIYVGRSGVSGSPITIRGDYPYHEFSNTSYAITVTMIGRSFVTFKNINFTKPYWYAGAGSTDIVIDGCSFTPSGGGQSFIDLYAGNDRWTIQNCSFTDGREGINAHYTGTSRIAANNLTVKNCTFKNMTASTDSHAVGMQGGQGHVVEGNYIENTGSAIQFWTDGSGGPPMGGHIVRGNFIKDVHSLSMGSGICIYDNMQNPTAGSLDYIIDHNIIVNAWGAGIYFGTIENRPFYIYNNTIKNVGYGVGSYGTGIQAVLTDSDGVGVVYNNIIVDPTTYYISLSSQKYVSLNVDNNLFYSTGAAKKWFMIIARNTFAEYQSTGYDANGMLADPLFVSASQLIPEDFSLQSGSPAINAGFNYGNLIDFFGNLNSGVIDMGAIEWYGVLPPAAIANFLGISV